MTSKSTHSVGFIGLGNMGSALARNALKQDISIAGYNRSPKKTDKLTNLSGFTPTYSLQELIKKLQPPRIIWLMLAVGEPIDQTLFGTKDSPGLIKLLDQQDIIIDGANSFYKHSRKRAKKLAQQTIYYLDAGTSGGVTGAQNGASIMVGGEQTAFQQAEFLFQALAAQDGYGYFGKPGAGHFVKMVHNGIEYGMMQAIAEGAAILNASEYQPDLNLATQVWSNGSIIKSNLVKWLHTITLDQPNLEQTQPTIGSLGTGKWTAKTAMDLGIPSHVISAAVNARYESRPEAKFGRKVVQALREHFGMHNTKERDAH